MLKTGLVANLEDSQEMEADLEGGYVRKDGFVRSASLWHTPSAGSTNLAMMLAPHTPPIAHAPRPKVPFSASSPSGSQGDHPWLCSWAQLPLQKEGLLSAEDTKAKLHQICGNSEMF
jgi:hypothetical protein